MKCEFWFFLQLLSEAFLILDKIQRDIIINVHKPSCKVTPYSCHILMKFEFSRQISKNTQIPNLLKNRPVWVELYHAHGQT